VEGAVTLPGGGRISFSIEEYPGKIQGDEKREIWVDHDSLRTSTFIVRSWRPGDKFQPLGMSGTKKVSDLFVDKKIPRQHKYSYPLILNGESVVWVCGLRMADPFKITKNTRRAVHIRYYQS
jgi:tRNA(Ile)-lysidine synthase